MADIKEYFRVKPKEFIKSDTYNKILQYGQGKPIDTIKELIVLRDTSQNDYIMKNSEALIRELQKNVNSKVVDDIYKISDEEKAKFDPLLKTDIKKNYIKMYNAYKYDDKQSVKSKMELRKAIKRAEELLEQEGVNPYKLTKSDNAVSKALNFIGNTLSVGENVTAGLLMKATGKKGVNLFDNNGYEDLVNHIQYLNNPKYKDAINKLKQGYILSKQEQDYINSIHRLSLGIGLVGGVVLDPLSILSAGTLGTAKNLNKIRKLKGAVEATNIADIVNTTLNKLDDVATVNNNIAKDVYKFRDEWDKLVSPLQKKTVQNADIDKMMIKYGELVNMAKSKQELLEYADNLTKQYANTVKWRDEIKQANDIFMSNGFKGKTMKIQDAIQTTSENIANKIAIKTRLRKLFVSDLPQEVLTKEGFINGVSNIKDDAIRLSAVTIDEFNRLKRKKLKDIDKAIGNIPNVDEKTKNIIMTYIIENYNPKIHKNIDEFINDAIKKNEDKMKIGYDKLMTADIKKVEKFTELKLTGKKLDDGVGEVLEKGEEKLKIEYKGKPKIELNNPELLTDPNLIQADKIKIANEYRNKQLQNINDILLNIKNNKILKSNVENIVVETKQALMNTARRKLDTGAFLTSNKLTGSTAKKLKEYYDAYQKLLKENPFSPDIPKYKKLFDKLMRDERLVEGILSEDDLINVAENKYRKLNKIKKDVEIDKEELKKFLDDPANKEDVLYIKNAPEYMPHIRSEEMTEFINSLTPEAKRAFSNTIAKQDKSLKRRMLVEGVDDINTLNHIKGINFKYTDAITKEEKTIEYYGDIFERDYAKILDNYATNSAQSMKERYFADNIRQFGFSGKKQIADEYIKNGVDTNTAKKLSEEYRQPKIRRTFSRKARKDLKTNEILSGYYYKDIAHAIENMYSISQSKNTWDKMIDVFNSMQNLWKVLTINILPIAFVKDVIGNINMVFMNMKNPKDIPLFLKNFNMATEVMKGNKEVLSKKILTKTGEMKTYKEVIDEMIDYGVKATGYVSNELNEYISKGRLTSDKITSFVQTIKDLPQNIKEIFINSNNRKELIEKLNNIDISNISEAVKGKIEQASKLISDNWIVPKLREQQDLMFKYALTLFNYEKGMPIKNALEEAYKYIFDYTKQTEFTKKAKIIFPFLSWVKNNTALQLGNVFNPTTINLFKAQKKLNKKDDSDIDERFMGDWLAQEIKLPVGFGQYGDKLYILLESYLPTFELSRFIRLTSKLVTQPNIAVVAEEIAKDLSSFITFPFELWFNKNFRTGKELEKSKYAKGYAFGHTNPIAYKIASMVRPINVLMKANLDPILQQTNPMPIQDYNRFISALILASPVSYTPEYARRSKIAEFNKDFQKEYVDFKKTTENINIMANQRGHKIYKKDAEMITERLSSNIINLYVMKNKGVIDNKTLIARAKQLINKYNEFMNNYYKSQPDEFKQEAQEIFTKFYQDVEAGNLEDKADGN